MRTYFSRGKMNSWFLIHRYWTIWVMSGIPHPKKLLENSSCTISISLYALRETSSHSTSSLRHRLQPIIVDTHDHNRNRSSMSTRWVNSSTALGGVSTARFSLSSVRSLMTGTLQPLFTSLITNIKQLSSVNDPWVDILESLFTQTRFGTGAGALIISTCCTVVIRARRI